MVQKRLPTAIRKEQIVAAAKKLIIKRGSEHVTIRAIAREIGLSEGAVYRHFSSKRDILSLLADTIEEDLLGDLTSGNNKKGSSLAILDVVLKSHISGINQKQGISFQVIAEIISMGDKKLNTRFYAIISRYIDKLAELIERGIKSEELRQDMDPYVAATYLYGMIQGLVNIWALNNFKSNLMDKYLPLWGLFKDSIIKDTRCIKSLDILRN
jgi:AcrR family transcriptional regulator